MRLNEERLAKKTSLCRTPQARQSLWDTPYASLAPCGLLDSGLGLAGMDPLLDGRPLVVLLLAFAERDLDLYKSLFKIHAKRHDRDPFASGLPHQTVDLAPLEQQFARPDRVQFLIPLDLRIGRNMTIQEKCFLPHDTHVTVFQVHAPLTNGFNLVTREAYARFIPVVDEVVVMSLPILGNHLERRFYRLGRGSRVFFLFHRFNNVVGDINGTTFNSPLKSADAAHNFLES